MTMPHNKNLEELFNLADTDDPSEESPFNSEGSDPGLLPSKTLPANIASIDVLDKIEASLPMVRDLSASDAELDDLSATALAGYKDLVDLGMNVDSRSAAEILSVASSMLGHAISAKTAKINRKLKTIELQLKKAKLDQDQEKKSGAQTTGTEVPGAVFDRNELIAMLKQKPE